MKLEVIQMLKLLQGLKKKTMIKRFFEKDYSWEKVRQYAEK